MPKKIFLAFGAVFVVLLIIIVVQLFSKKQDVVSDQQPDSTQQPEQPNTDDQPDPTTQDKNAKVKIIVQGPVRGATLSADGSKIMYYQDSKILTTDAEGTTKNSIGAYPFEQVDSFEWSSKKDRALVHMPWGYSVYTLNTDEAINLQGGIDFAAWSLQGDKLIYKFYDSNAKERSINMADPDGSNLKKLITIPFKKIDFQIRPESGTIYYHQTADSFAPTELDSIDFSGENHKKIFEGKYGADFLWAPDGKKLLVSFVFDKGGKRTDIAVMNPNGGELRALDFPSVVDKCVWAKDSITIYCGFMAQIPADAVMPNDWLSKKFHSADTFWKINTETGKKERLVDTTEIPAEIDAVHFFLDKEEKNLFFVERESGDLYRIAL